MLAILEGVRPAGNTVSTVSVNSERVRSRALIPVDSNSLSPNSWTITNVSDDKLASDFNLETVVEQ